MDYMDVLCIYLVISYLYIIVCCLRSISFSVRSLGQKSLCKLSWFIPKFMHRTFAVKITYIRPHSHHISGLCRRYPLEYLEKGILMYSMAEL